jgi:hypothetical protein
MNEYTEVQQPFLQQPAAQGWTVRNRSGLWRAERCGAESVGQTSSNGCCLPCSPPQCVRLTGLTTAPGPKKEWLTERQLENRRNQLLRQPM